MSAPDTLRAAMGRLDSARAVASILIENLPCAAGNSPLYAQTSLLGDLIGAVIVCLDQVAQDLDTLEDHFNHEGASA